MTKRLGRKLAALVAAGVALGALAGIVRLPRDAFHEAIRQRFAGKAPAMIAGNVEAFDLGHAHGAKVPKADAVDFGMKTYERPEAVDWHVGGGP